jgi:hypothetical protein
MFAVRSAVARWTRCCGFSGAVRSVVKVATCASTWLRSGLRTHHPCLKLSHRREPIRRSALSTALFGLEWPTVKSVESPDCYSPADQNPGGDRDPRNHKSPIVGVVRDVPSVSRSRNAEPAKANKTGPTGRAAPDITAQYEGQTFASSTRSRMHQIRFAMGALVIKRRTHPWRARGLIHRKKEEAFAAKNVSAISGVGNPECGPTIFRNGKQPGG